MANCNKCKNQFYSKECPHCKRIEWEKNLNKNNKIDGSEYNPKAMQEMKRKRQEKQINLNQTMQNS